MENIKEELIKNQDEDIQLCKKRKYRYQLEKLSVELEQMERTYTSKLTEYARQLADDMKADLKTKYPDVPFMFRRKAENFLEVKCEKIGEMVFEGADRGDIIVGGLLHPENDEGVMRILRAEKKTTLEISPEERDILIDEAISCRDACRKQMPKPEHYWKPVLDRAEKVLEGKFPKFVVIKNE